MLWAERGIFSSLAQEDAEQDRRSTNLTNVLRVVPQTGSAAKNVRHYKQLWRRRTMSSHRYLHPLFPLVAGAAVLLASVEAADARVTRIVISQTTSPAFNGQSFAGVGQYEMIRGTASGEKICHVGASNEEDQSDRAEEQD